MQKPCGKIRIPFTPDRMSERSLEGRRQKAEGRREKGEARVRQAVAVMLAATWAQR
ncbi:TPA: hypothetical protein PRY57_004857 [Escherichia coli]|nr:hypothetical protein [Escherichia coli]HDK2661912.1 hypothetical protein [Escherichia coli]